MSKTDYILTGGRFYTSDEARPWADTVAVGDGRFLFVGKEEDLPEELRDREVIDLGGRLVLPGLVDAHAHVGLSALLGDDDGQMPAYHCKSKEEVLETLRREVKAHPLRLFYGMIYGQAEAIGPEGIHRKELDKIVRRPVVLLEEECHSCFVNSAALKAIGVKEDTPDPAPGYSYYDRDEEGRLTGGIKEMAMMPLLKLAGDFRKEKMRAGMKRILDNLADHGVTSVFDAGSYLKEEGTFRILKEMDEKGEIPIRIEASHIIFKKDQLPGAIEEFKRLRSLYETEHIHFHTMKMMLDGTQRVRTAKMVTPYEDSDTTGGTLISADQMEQFILDLEEEGIDFHLHTVGEGAVRMVMDGVQKARETLGRPLRIRVTCAHVEVLHPDDIDRFRELGIIADFTPSWHGGACAAEIPVMERLLGEYRANHSLQAKTVMDTGAVVTFSSDEVSLHALERWSPFLGMEIGHTRQEINDGGKAAPVFPPEEERLTLEELIKGYTVNGAFQLRMEDRIGSMDAGKEADMVILKEDLFTMDPYSIHAIRPSFVIIRGEWR